PASAFAYDETVHAFITRHALPLDRPVAPPTQDDLDTFRAQFWVRASEHPGFERRYPTIHDFDAWAFKEFLMLDPAARVHGFEPLPDDNAGTLHRLLERASRWPDDDERNRHRYLHDRRTREIVRAPDGSPIPYDPATLDFGSLTGTTSQGHAHYGLVEGPLSDDPEVLKKEPWRFAVPPTAHAYGVELVQLYTDLSALAAQSRLPSAVWLQAAFAGAAFHHLEDLCNQIHTVQVGIYEFLETALLESKLRDLQTLGGLFGERHSLQQVGLRLIANHHMLSEDLFAKHLGEMQLAGIDQPDPDIAAAPDLARAIIERSSREGPQVYRLAWRFSTQTLRDGVSGHEYDGSKGDDPDAYVERTSEAQAAIEEFHAIEIRGLRRAVTAVREWQRRFPGKPHDPVPQLVAYHEQAAARQLGRVRPLSAGGRHCARGHVFRQPEQLGHVLRRHALELVQLRELAEPGQALQEVHPRRTGPSPELAHHFLHRKEPVEQPADVFLALAGPPGDALDALDADHRGVLPLGPGHRGDDGLDPVQLLVVEGDALRQLAEERELLEQLVDTAHLLHQLDLLDEVVEAEVAGEDLLRVLLGLLLVDHPLEVLHQSDDVAESENAGGEPLGPELLELVQRLAPADELDELARDLLV